ncbi:MAG TPA: hypothetical protein VFP68_08890 [Burkholderiaceae bacterium]|nr:hypothetical protein [Burkholderiaceae bacterium]
MNDQALTPSSPGQRRRGRKTRRTKALDDLKLLLVQRPLLTLGSLIAVIATPILVARAGAAPLWPQGMGFIAGLVGIVMLAFVFLIRRRGTPERRGGLLLTSVVLMTVCAIIYALAFAFLTYRVPITHERYARGLKCTTEALTTFEAHCPWLRMDELRALDYDPERTWTKGSIAVVEVSMMWAWSLAWISLALASGTLVTDQVRILRRLPSGAP